MSTHVGVTVWWEDEDGEAREDEFSYFGPCPEINDVFALDTNGSDQTDAPDGIYVVQRRTFHFPMMGYRILLVQVVDAGDSFEQTPDDSKED